MLDSLRNWHNYFTQNSSDTNDFPWNLSERLTAEERDCIEDSIAAFQLGEYSEGKGLLRSAQKYARKQKDEYLVAITRLFIAEEQNHALLLRRFMTIHNIKLASVNWTDTIFRRLRKNVRFELSITVLITAEIISLVYYKALKEATNSYLLKRICEKILADEEAHVRYESELLKCMRGQMPIFIKRLILFLHRFLFFGTVLVVYLSHRKALARGGYGFFRYWSVCWFEFSTLFDLRAIARRQAGVSGP